MRKALLITALALAGCASSTSDTSVAGGVPSSSPSLPLPTPTPVTALFQNPFLSPNPSSNIHNDSYLSDSYAFSGPTQGQARFDQLNEVEIIHPETGRPHRFILGDCGGQAIDGQGNIQTIGGGIPNPVNSTATRQLVTLDRNTLKVLAYASFTTTFPDLNDALTDFGGAGYFYQDNQYRVVVGTPDGHVQVLARQKSAVSDVDRYVAVKDYNVLGTGGAVTGPAGLKLYALMPDKAGNIWFTTNFAIVGTITPDGVIRSWDINAPGGQGPRVPQSDGNFEEIANSHAVDEGDNDQGPSGVYVLTTYNLYRFSANPDGSPQLVWKGPYDHGPQQKPGQVSWGSGSSPTVFHQGGRRFVTITDNATQMHVNVYRAEATLAPGETRLYAQTTPFGDNQLVADENSLIVAPAREGGTNIYAENNYGYTGPSSVRGEGVTQPGFARMLLRPDGTFAVASVNNEIRVPTVVSKISIPANIVYTYEKRTTGWYLTGLDATDLNRVRFSTFSSTGVEFNNHYSALSLDPDGRTIYFGTVLGFTRAQF